MKIESYPETRTVYLSLIDEPRPATETREISPGLKVDYDADRKVIGIEIEDASLLDQKKPSTSEIVLTWVIDSANSRSTLTTTLADLSSLVDETEKYNIFMYRLGDDEKETFRNILRLLPSKKSEKKATS